MEIYLHNISSVKGDAAMLLYKRQAKSHGIRAKFGKRNSTYSFVSNSHGYYLTHEPGFLAGIDWTVCYGDHCERSA